MDYESVKERVLMYVVIISEVLDFVFIIVIVRFDVDLIMKLSVYRFVVVFLWFLCYMIYIVMVMDIMVIIM